MKLKTEVVSVLLKRHYALEPVEVERLGISENEVYAVTLAEPTAGVKKVFVRVHQGDPQYEENLPGEWVLLEGLQGAMSGQVPRVLKALDQEAVKTFQFDGCDWLLMVFSWVAGEHRSSENVQVADVVAMASATACFHQAASSVVWSPPRPLYDYSVYCGPDTFYHRPDLSEHILSSDLAPFFEFRKRLRFFVEREGARDMGWIHWDLHLGNFLFEGTQAHIIDFDECGWGYPLFDLGHILFGLHEHPRYQEFEEAFIATYEEVRGAVLPFPDLMLFKGAQANACIRYFFRLYDRTSGATNLFNMVPGISKSLTQVLERI